MRSIRKIGTTLALGILAVLAIPTSSVGTSPAGAAEAPAKFRLCTGSNKKNYYAAGQLVKKAAGTDVDIDVIPTGGSIDNLKKLLAGECDGLFAQADSTLVFSADHAEMLSMAERAGVLYTEEVIGACSRKSGITSIGDIKPETVVATSGGSETTFAAFKLANKSLKGTSTSLEGNRAIGAVADGSEVQCLLDVASRGTPFVKRSLSASGDQIVLIETYLKGMEQIKDARGRAIYGWTTLPGSTYPTIARRSGLFNGTEDIYVTTVDALFLGSVKFIQAQPKVYDRVLEAFRDAGPDIKRLVNPKN